MAWKPHWLKREPKGREGPALRRTPLPSATPNEDPTMTRCKKRLHCLATLAALITGLTVQAQMGGGMMHGKDDQQDRPMDPSRMTERCEEMQAQMQQMQKQRQARQEELQSQLEAMEEAEGDAKIDAMAKILRAMVDQREQMLEQRQEMMSKMMGHMSEHMTMQGNDGERARMMMKCPMMQEMGSGSDDQRGSKGAS
ncbi:MAG: hypothetical protein ACLFU2_11975 [Opitutales bacterium]